MHQQRRVLHILHWSLEALLHRSQPEQPSIFQPHLELLLLVCNFCLMGQLHWNSIIEVLFFLGMSTCISSASSALVMFAGNMQLLSGSLGAGWHDINTHSFFPTCCFALMDRTDHLLLCSSVPDNRETLFCTISYLDKLVSSS